VISTLFFLEGIVIGGQLFIEFGTVNVMKSGFDMKIPDFVDK
jgi:hypothetical protein